MNIVWISHSANIAGAELCLFEAVKAICLNNYVIRVVLPSDNLLSFKLQQLKGVSTKTIPFSWWVESKKLTENYFLRNIKSQIKSIIKLRKYLKEVQPDIVITNTITIFIGAIVSKILGIPHIWYIHEFGDLDHNLKYFIFGKRVSMFLINYLSDSIIINSQAVKKHFSEWLSPNKMQLVNCAVETKNTNYENKRFDNLFRIIMVGRITSGKRQEDAIRAVNILVKKKLKVHLTIVGEGDTNYFNFINILVNRLNLENHVSFIPFTNDPFFHISKSDISLICSKNEAFGRVTIEAMKLGKPVIGARNGGTVELIKEGFNGLLYNTEDYQDLSKKIEYLYNNRNLSRKIGKNAELWAKENFSIEKYGNDLIKIVKNIIYKKRIE